MENGTCPRHAQCVGCRPETETCPLCVLCREPVRLRQHALECECGEWQHRTCDTGIDVELYRRMVRGDADEELNAWKCEKCSHPDPPVGESTRLSEDLEADMADMSDIDDNNNESLNDSSLSEFSHGTVSTVEEVQEESLTHPADVTIDELETTDTSEGPTTYTVVEESSRRGRKKLVSSEGYSYTVKKTGENGSIQWRCAVRNKSVTCRAIVLQKGEYYRPGLHNHCHPPELAATLHARISVELKKRAKDEVFEPASNLVPLAFALMSGKNKGDYNAVFSELLDALPEDIAVQECVVDYEETMWRVIPQLLPHVRIRGCYFHWKQAVWRKAQELGLQKPYMEDERIHRWLRRLLALPCLPAAAIPAAFAELKTKVAGCRQLRQLTDYMDSTWLSGSIWTPRRWSVYCQSVRTTNDVEGWHNRLNLKAKKANLPMYLLILLLHKEGELVKVYSRLVAEGKLRRYQRVTYRRVQGRLFDAWDNFATGQTTAKELLEVCSKMFGAPL